MRYSPAGFEIGIYAFENIENDMQHPHMSGKKQKQKKTSENSLSDAFRWAVLGLFFKGLGDDESDDAIFKSVSVIRQELEWKKSNKL